MFGFFFLIFTVFVQSLNFLLSLTLLHEQVIPLVLLDLLTKYAGDAQP